MDYMFPRQGFEGCSNQYMLGDKYLVAPMIEPGTQRTVKLPEGMWQDDLGQILHGPLVLELKDVQLERLPYYQHMEE